jgi:hypothetical protein
MSLNGTAAVIHFLPSFLPIHFDLAKKLYNFSLHLDLGRFIRCEVRFLLERVRGSIVHFHLYFDGGTIIRKALLRLEVSPRQRRCDR